MKTFVVAIFLLLSEAASAEFGVDARDRKRRHLQALRTTARRAKSVKSKSKKNTKGKVKSHQGFIILVGDTSMSYMPVAPTLSKSQKTTLSDDSAVTAKSKGADKSKGSAKSKGPTKSKEGKEEKTSPSEKSHRGAEKWKGSEKSKEGTKEHEKSKGSAKSKGGTSLDFAKFVRSSLPNPSDAEEVQAEEQMPETANTLSSAKAESSASFHVITGAFLVGTSFVVAGMLIAA